MIVAIGALNIVIAKWTTITTEATVLRAEMEEGTTMEQPTMEQPTMEEPTTEEPTMEEPTTEEPTTEEASVGENGCTIIKKVSLILNMLQRVVGESGHHCEK